MKTYTRIYYTKSNGFETFMPVYNDGTTCKMSGDTNQGKVDRFRETAEQLNWTITKEEQTDSCDLGPSQVSSLTLTKVS